MKKFYQEPEFEISEFESEDVTTVSGVQNEGDDFNTGGPGGGGSVNPGF